MLVKDLRKRLKNMPDGHAVVFPANLDGSFFLEVADLEQMHYRSGKVGKEDVIKNGYPVVVLWSE